MSHLTLIAASQMSNTEMATAVTQLVQSQSLVGNKVAIETPIIHNGETHVFIRTPGLPDEPLNAFVTNYLGLPESAILRITPQGVDQSTEDYEQQIIAGFPRYLAALLTGQAICIQMTESEFLRWYRPGYSWYPTVEEQPA